MIAAWTATPLVATAAAAMLHAGITRSGFRTPSRVAPHGAQRIAARVIIERVRLVAARSGLGERRRRGRLRAELPEVLDVVARSLRGGRSLHQALEDVVDSAQGPLRDEFAEALRHSHQGQSLEAALRSTAKRIDDAEVSTTMQALLLAIESGGGPSRALDGIGQSARDRAALRDEVAALVSQARTSMRVLAALPIVFVGIGALVDPSSLTFFASDPVGRLCLLGGVVLDVLGFAWMHRLLGGLA